MLKEATGETQHWDRGAPAQPCALESDVSKQLLPWETGGKGTTGPDDTTVITTVVIITWHHQGRTCQMSLTSP